MALDGGLGWCHDELSPILQLDKQVWTRPHLTHYKIGPLSNFAFSH